MPEPEDTSDDAPTTAEFQARAMRGSWWTALQATAGAPVSFVANLVVARSLGPHGFGLTASYMVGYLLITGILNGGVSDGTIQWGAAAYARGDRRELIGLARRCSGYHLLVEGPLGAVATAWMLRHESLPVQVFGACAVAAVMAFGTSVVIVTAISGTSVLARQALFVGLAVQVAVMVAALQTHDPGWVWACRAAFMLVAALLPLLTLEKDLRRAVLKPEVPIGWPQGFAQYSARSLVAGLVGALVFSRCEVLVLDSYGLLDQAGVFALAAGIAVQITAPIDAMLGPLVPAAASLVATSRDLAPEAIYRGIRLSALAIVPILCVVVPALTFVTPLLYGDKFQSVGVLFLALALVSCLQSALHAVTAFVGSVRRPLVVMCFNGAALAIDLSLVFALAPRFGAPAAVLASSVGQLVSLSLSLLLLRRELGLDLRTTVEALRAPLLVTVGVLASSLPLIQLPIGPLAAAPIAVAIALACAWLVLRLGGGVVAASDIRAVGAALPRRLSPLTTVADRLGLVR